MKKEFGSGEMKWEDQTVYGRSKRKSDHQSRWVWQCNSFLISIEKNYPGLEGKYTLDSEQLGIEDYELCSSACPFKSAEKAAIKKVKETIHAMLGDILGIDGDMP